MITVEVVLFEISNSMKTYPSGFHARTSKLRPAIGCFEPNKFDEVSSLIPPTSHDCSIGCFACLPLLCLSCFVC